MAPVAEILPRTRRASRSAVEPEEGVDRLRERARELETERVALLFRARGAERLRVELDETRKEVGGLQAELRVARERARPGSQLVEENARLRTKVAGLEKTNEGLLERIEAVERAGKRQAAPFSKGPPKVNPKPPGRKPGAAYGTGAFRPVPERIDEVIDVPLPQVCEGCGGHVVEVSIASQWQTDLPPVEPITRQFRLHLGACECCGQRVQPRHPLQTSDALGAAAVQIGPKALSTATLLAKSFAVAWRKIATLFERAFSFKVAASTLCRAALRVASRLEPTYHALVRTVRSSAVVYADETGWRTGGHKRWLWGFTTLRVTVFVIAASRGGDVVLEVLGVAFAGVLVRDGWAAYRALVNALFQTCFFHLLRRAHEILEVAKRGEAKLAHAVLRLLNAALGLRDRREELTEHGFATLRGKLEARADRLLGWDPAYKPNAKFVKHLRNERPHLFTFLHRPDVEPTNWPGEHAMRAGVLARKVSGGSRTDRGSKAHSILTSILTTAAQQARDTLALLGAAFRARAPVELDLLPRPEA